MPATQLKTRERPVAIVRRRMQSARLRAYGALALGVLCIGFSAIFTKWADLPGSVSAFYRVLIATADRNEPDSVSASMHADEARIATCGVW